MRTNTLNITPGKITFLSGPIGSGKTHELLLALNKEKGLKAYIGDGAYNPILVHDQNTHYIFSKPYVHTNHINILHDFLKEIINGTYKFIVIDDLHSSRKDYDLDQSMFLIIQKYINKNTKIVFVSEKEINLLDWCSKAPSNVETENIIFS